jgi:HAMP domain-containing protein
MTDDREVAPPGRTKRRISIGMRWKLLIAFGLGFTVVFAAVAVWILRFSTDTATERVEETLRSISVGGATTIDTDAFLQLLEVDPTVVPGERYPDSSGYLAGSETDEQSEYLTDDRYWAHVKELADIRRTNPDASPYTFYAAPDGTVRFVGSWGALGYPRMMEDPPDGGKFMQDVLEIIDEPTLEYFRRGLVETTEQPAYVDALDTWISAYTPITTDDGTVIGAIGVDYPLSYVDEVRSRVLRVLYPVFGLAYLVLLVLVVYLSGWLTRRIGRIAAATQRMADGDYDVDLRSVARSVFPDEMTELASSFVIMSDKVDRRQRALVQQVQVLKVEIDETKRREAVEAITDSDFFASLSAKAGMMRAKVKAADEVAAAGVAAADGGHD